MLILTFTPVGYRVCIGREFAETEAVRFLAMHLREYRVELILSGGETRAQWSLRVLDRRLALTLTVQDVLVTFVRRGRD
ncbi:hypothetical protein HYPSUDRAFT_42037 [Hypholoma sublateritium FD-334 SS-4]|uniref:Cytochrome P450 n=1 Tax=Hypholoma sublateritium (strain FD-334 SS-4) TaxID=945553 RepID=A0A0D2NY30_HYPSF|nr:hypothetical protein HYPSUDRAFT_42037 [Hypholoma sublateritium FD-334 SS-4]